MSALELILLLTTLGGVGGMFLMKKKDGDSKPEQTSFGPQTPQNQPQQTGQTQVQPQRPVQVQSQQSPAQNHQFNNQTPRPAENFRGQETQRPQFSNVNNSQQVLDAQTRAKELLLEAKDQALKVKTQAEEESRKIRHESLELEKRLESRQEMLDRKITDLEKKEMSLSEKESKATAKLAEIEDTFKQQTEKLEKISSMTKEEAKKFLLSNVERDLAGEVAKRIRESEEKIKSNVDQKAKEIMVDSMLHASTDYVVEYTVSKVKLPDEDMKGRIIGKEGRNIKVFEELTGVNLDMDEGTEVRISSFDPVRREIAKISLEKLLADGRIQPAKIEEVIERTKKEIDHIMFKEGEELCHKVGAFNIHKDLIYMLGKFKYRFSYGQNMIQHTLEETKLGMKLASEIGLDINVVRLGCLFHDIGKIVTDEEGSHVQLGVDLLKKYRIAEPVVNCVAEHHEDKPFSSLESVVVHIADSISGARPGARSEDYEAYVKRMRDLEAAATSFTGVDKAYAISAGREVRVFVRPERVDDTSCTLLAREIAKKIELEQTYPGTVKVAVIRETRAYETAK